MIKSQSHNRSMFVAMCARVSMNMENIHPVDQINLFLVVVPAKLSCSLIIATHLIICIDSATNTNLVVKLVSAHVLKGFMTKHTVGIVAVVEMEGGVGAIESVVAGR